MDEAEIAGSGFVVSGCDTACVLEPVDAPFDEVSQGIDEVVDGGLDLAGFAHGNDSRAAAGLDIIADAIGIITPIGQQDLRFGPAFHHRIVTLVVRDLTAGDLSLHGQTAAIGAEVNLAREATY